MRPVRTLGRRRVLVDSSAYFALADRSGADYRIALPIRNRLATERWRVFTTNFIVAETHALVLARRNRFEAAQFLQLVDQSSDTTIVRVSNRDERRAREIIIQYVDKDFSLTDAISFAVMERLRIESAFAFDRHFAQFGFAVFGAASPA